MNTAELIVTSELAKDFFKLANGVTIFHIIQTMLFFGSLTKPGMRVFVSTENAFVRKIIWASAFLYIGAALLCSISEIILRVAADQPINVVTTSLILAVGRLFLIAAVSFGCTLLSRQVRA